jgi:hypothetical protein
LYPLRHIKIENNSKAMESVKITGKMKRLFIKAKIIEITSE